MDPLLHLLYRHDSPARADVVADLGLAIVADAGLAALTPARVAAAAGCSRQAVHQWFGGQQQLRLTFARLVTGRWLRWAEVRVHGHGPVGLLPDEEHALALARAWLALVDAAARDSELARLVAAIEATEIEVLTHDLEARARQVGAPLCVLPDAVAALHAVIVGQRVLLAVRPRGAGVDEEALARSLRVVRLAASGLPGTPLRQVA